MIVTMTTITNKLFYSHAAFNPFSDFSAISSLQIIVYENSNCLHPQQAD